MVGIKSIEFTNEKSSRIRLVVTEKVSKRDLSEGAIIARGILSIFDENKQNPEGIVYKGSGSSGGGMRTLYLIEVGFTVDLDQ
ncbi:MAG: hypothetical protein ACI9DF_002540 [Verrucomicrobiales bacterium]|jgi:hypothetical protein